jgi:O-antigen/teichoic acid export membrane protein
MLIGNVAARVAALACVMVATLLLAWQGGPELVGAYALLHVLPGLVATVASCGLPVAVPYFLAGPRGGDRRVPLTLLAIALAGAAAGMVLWIVAAPVTGSLLFGDLAPELVLVAGVAVLTRLLVVTAKACSQGSSDLAGANRVIVLEELMFVPAYAALAATGAGVEPAMVLALVVADVVTAATAWRRLVRRGFLAAAQRPSAELAREVAGYGLRAQTGGLLAQLNLRLDFVLLAALTTPAVLGVYAIASKFAELLRLVTMSLTYVLYPAYAREGRVRAAAAARRLLPRAALLSAGAAACLWVAAGPVIATVYGEPFEAAISPSRIILLGLALEGAAAVVTAFLHGVGRPGLNSWAMASGLAMTIALDLVLIPRYGATGAAVASAAAYGTASLVLIWIFSRVGRAKPRALLRTGTLTRAEAR